MEETNVPIEKQRQFVNYTDTLYHLSLYQIHLVACGIRSCSDIGGDSNRSLGTCSCTTIHGDHGVLFKYKILDYDKSVIVYIHDFHFCRVIVLIIINDFITHTLLIITCKLVLF